MLRWWYRWWVHNFEETQTPTRCEFISTLVFTCIVHE